MVGTAAIPWLFRSSTGAAETLKIPVNDLVLETVTGPVEGSKIEWTMGHEHLTTSWEALESHDYMDSDWADVVGSCVGSLSELRAQGVNLFVDWTPLGIGRNILLYRNVSRQTGVYIIAPTGIYKARVPVAMRHMTVDQMAEYFVEELTQGMEGTAIKAGFIKIATTEKGTTKEEAKVHRAAAIAAKETGATLGLHSPYNETTAKVVAAFESEGLGLHRLVSAHMQCSDHQSHEALAARGVTMQFDAISARSDPWFDGPTDDDSMLDRIENLIKKGFEDQVIVSTDACVCIFPAKYQYDRNNTYLYRYFKPKLEERIGKELTKKVLRDNVIHAFRRAEVLSPTPKV